MTRFTAKEKNGIVHDVSVEYDWGTKLWLSCHPPTRDAEGTVDAKNLFKDSTEPTTCLLCLGLEQ